MANIIYFFSGTGNSLAVALSVAQKLKETEVVSIVNLRNNKSIPSKYERVGFVFPCFYSHPSPIVVDLIKELSFCENQKIFIIVTYGGISGFAISDVKQIIEPKTHNSIQGFSVKLPGNHIVGYSAIPEYEQQSMFKKAQRNMDVITNKIRHDASTKIRKHSKMETFVWDLVVKAINKKLGIQDIYQTQAEFFTTNSCTHCGKCEQVCPVHNIAVSPTEVTFSNKCQQCMACIQWCPQMAISHPNITPDRKGYHHPDITRNDMIQYNKSIL